MPLPLGRYYVAKIGNIFVKSKSFIDKRITFNIFKESGPGRA